MAKLNTDKAGKTLALKNLLTTYPKVQEKNWKNGLIPYFMLRLEELNGKPLTLTKEKNWQAINFLINKKLMREFALLRKAPWPKDFAMALEWIWQAGCQVPENKIQMTNFVFIYKNFEKIMKKEICKKMKI